MHFRLLQQRHSWRPTDQEFGDYRQHLANPVTDIDQVMPKAFFTFAPKPTDLYLERIAFFLTKGFNLDLVEKTRISSKTLKSTFEFFPYSSVLKMQTGKLHRNVTTFWI